MSDRMIRVFRPGLPTDGWLVRRGDRTTLDVPGGRVTLELSGGWSESGIAYCALTYKPIRAGLLSFARHRSPGSVKPEAVLPQQESGQS